MTGRQFLELAALVHQRSDPENSALIAWWHGHAADETDRDDAPDRAR